MHLCTFRCIWCTHKYFFVAVAHLPVQLQVYIIYHLHIPGHPLTAFHWNCWGECSWSLLHSRCLCMKPGTVCGAIYMVGLSWNMRGRPRRPSQPSTTLPTFIWEDESFWQSVLSLVGSLSSMCVAHMGHRTELASPDKNRKVHHRISAAAMFMFV